MFHYVIIFCQITFILLWENCKLVSQKRISGIFIFYFIFFQASSHLLQYKIHNCSPCSDVSQLEADKFLEEQESSLSNNSQSGAVDEEEDLVCLVIGFNFSCARTHQNIKTSVMCILFYFYCDQRQFCFAILNNTN